jgi:hypothetical protein
VVGGVTLGACVVGYLASRCVCTATPRQPPPQDDSSLHTAARGLPGIPGIPSFLTDTASSDVVSIRRESIHPSSDLVTAEGAKSSAVVLKV